MVYSALSGATSSGGFRMGDSIMELFAGIIFILMLIVPGFAVKVIAILILLTVIVVLLAYME